MSSKGVRKRSQALGLMKLPTSRSSPMETVQAHTVGGLMCLISFRVTGFTLYLCFYILSFLPK